MYVPALVSVDDEAQRRAMVQLDLAEPAEMDWTIARSCASSSTLLYGGTYISSGYARCARRASDSPTVRLR